MATTVKLEAGAAGHGAEPRGKRGDDGQATYLIAIAEALWEARVFPWAPLGSVSDEELAHALEWTRVAMRAAVRAPRGPRSVYRRAGRPCRRCGTPIASRGPGSAPSA